MDWPNERYVRLFTRNTTTWRRLGWDGQCVMMHLLRLVDRAGVLDIQDLSPAEAVALHAGAPQDVAERGIARMLELGVIAFGSGHLVFPNFLEAQECPMSDKLRAKNSRQRRSTSHFVTAPSHYVTERHAESRDVTPSHIASHRVTPSLPDPILPNPAEPSRSEPRDIATAVSEPKSETRIVRQVSDAVEPTFERQAEAAFGEQFDALYFEQTKCKPLMAWNARSDAGHLSRFEQLCCTYAKNVPGLNPGGVAQAVINGFFERPSRTHKNALFRFMVKDFEDLARDSESLRALVESLRGAA